MLSTAFELASTSASGILEKASRCLHGYSNQRRINETADGVVRIGQSTATVNLQNAIKL
jgi:hypothetical protein